MTKDHLSCMLMRHGLIQPDAVSDPEGYDGMETMDQVSNMADEISKGWIPIEDIKASTTEAELAKAREALQKIANETWFSGHWVPTEEANALCKIAEEALRSFNSRHGGKNE